MRSLKILPAILLLSAVPVAATPQQPTTLGDVVDKIVAVPTVTKGRYENVPADPVVIRSARILEDKPAAATH